MERSEKLAKLKKRDAGKSNLLVVGNGNDFVEILEATVGELKSSLGNGVALNNLDDLLDQLSVLQSFQKEVKDLRDSIKAIKLPESVKIEGLDELVASIKVISEKKVPKAEKLDPAPFVEISEKVTILTDKISSLKAEPQGKAPADYIPTRRVMKVGNQLLFDDSFYTGGGGGGSSSGGGTTYNGIINGAAGGSATVTNGKLDVNATSSLTGQAIPSVGATTAVTTQIVDGSGNQITTFGGGTQYADGAARGTATGTLVMGDDGTLIQSVTAKTLNTQVVGADTGLVVNATLHGLTTAGGGSYVDVKVNPSGAVSTDASGSTLGANSGVDIGDVTINNASGASAVNIQDGGNSITIDGSLTNISGTVSLPTGAATSAKQLPDVHNVVITSGTVTADTELPAAAALADTTANPTVPAVGSFLMGWDGTNTVWDRLKQQGLNADAQTAHAKGVLETASNGYVYNGSTWDRLRGDTTGVSVKNIASALPAGTNNIGDVDVLTVNGVAPAFGTGARGATVQRVTIATDDSVPVTNAGTFAVQDSQLVADDAAFTIATTKVRPAGFLADETATDSVDEGDAGAARMTLDRKVIVTVQPHTAGGLSVANFTSGDTYTALTATAQVIKASAGKLYGYYIFNPNAVTSYVMVYNIAAASVTVGTSTALLVFAIPAGSAANIEMANGITFSNAGWSIAAATSGGGNTAPATALEAMVWYL